MIEKKVLIFNRSSNQYFFSVIETSIETCLSIEILEYLYHRQKIILLFQEEPDFPIDR